MEKKQQKKVKQVSKESLVISDEKIEELKEVFPEVFKERKIDFEKLKILLGSKIEEGIEKYNFTWAGKSNAFRNIQTTAKGTLIPDRMDSVDFDKTENLFIEGDNLEVLKLLQKSYQSKVKMIYIDPPYNTGKDFVYKDNFRDSIGNYQKMTGLVDEEGNKTDTNKETNGRFHSDWLTMMYPRLYLAKNLLKDDGVIFVSIDDHEVHNLRKIMDDIFGEENFVTSLIWRKKTGASDAKGLANVTEYVLVYIKQNNYLESSFSRNKESHDLNRYKLSDEYVDRRGKHYVDNLDRGGIRYSDSLNYGIKCPDGTVVFPNGRDSFKKDGWIWTWGKDKLNWGIKNGFIIFKKVKGKWRVYYKNYLYVNNQDKLIEKSAPHRNLIIDILNTDGTAELNRLFGGKIFDYPKPSDYIKRIVSLVQLNNNDIILDFFAGSGTTAHAVLDLNKEDGGNRKFICVQLPEKTDEKSEAYKAGYKTISDIAKERIRRVIKKIKEEDKEKAKNMDLGFKVFKLSKSNYKIWENYDGKDAKELLKQMELFKSPLISGYKKIDLIYEVLIKEGFDLNSKIEEVKGIKTNKVFRIDNGEKYFYICLDEKIKEQTIKDLKLSKDVMFVCLDDSLDDNQKINFNLKINLRSI